MNESLNENMPDYDQCGALVNKFGRQLDVAKRAVEIAIEQVEKAALD